MTAPLSTAILVRLSQLYAAAHPTESDEKVVRRARALIESLRSAGLDIVLSDWIDSPDLGRAPQQAAWDPFVEGIRVIYEQNKDRQPWRPEGV